MDIPVPVIVFLKIAGTLLYFLPTLVARARYKVPLAMVPLMGLWNLLLGWTVIGWFHQLYWVSKYGEKVPPASTPVMPTERSEPQPDELFANIFARLLELPPANRVLTLRTPERREIRVVLDSERPLTVRLGGSWSDQEKATARSLMQTAVDSRPDLARLMNPEDPLEGVVFTTDNQYSASRLVYQLVVEALGSFPSMLGVVKDYEDYDARPKIVDVLNSHGRANLHHEASGVKVRVTLENFRGPSAKGTASGSGYRLDVPTASLDPKRGQRHRARHAITDAGWRVLEHGGSPPDLEDSGDITAEFWGYGERRGDSKAAADAALRLLCKIAELPIDVRVSVTHASSSLKETVPSG